MMRRLAMLLLLIGVGLLATPAYAAEPEQRCTELGANCVCAESLNATAVTTHASGYAFNPTNSSTKECGGMDGKGAGYAIDDSNTAFTTRYTWDSTGEAITNLPAAHDASLTNVLRTKNIAEGNAGGGARYVGHYATTADYLTIFRFYRYLTTDYEWINGSACTNSAKVFEMGALPNLQMYMSSGSNPGPMGLTAWIGWTPSTIDCCAQGPATQSSGSPWILDPGPTQASLRGKWWRYEVRSRGNRTTDPAWHLDVYAKNITDNLTEQKIIDTDIVTTDRFGGPQWTSTLATTVKPSYGDIREFVINTFRRDTCAGSIAMSHVLVAGYTEDTGQRVGAAYEMEGGGSGVSATTSVSPGGFRMQGVLRVQ